MLRRAVSSIYRKSRQARLSVPIVARGRGGLVRARVDVPRRTTTWIAGLDNGTGTTVAAGAAVALASLNAAALALRPFTVIRVRGILSLRSDSLSTTELGAFAAGMAVVSDQVAAIGVTAIPTPITDQGSDLFFVHQFLHWSIGFGTAVGFDRAQSMIEIDSKGMRKVSDDQDIVVSFENESSTAGVIAKLTWRMLLKLH